MNGMTGVSYHRIYTPLHDLMIRSFADVDVWTPKDEHGKYRPLPDLKRYDLVIWNGTLAEPQDQVIAILNELNIPFIVDLDDYWRLNRYNPAYHEWEARQLGTKIQKAVFHANAVICENDRLAKEAMKINRNAYVVPNALNLTDLQWNVGKKPSPKFRVGYVGSRSHRYDLMIVSTAVREFCEETGSEFHLCGYHPSDTEWTAIGYELAPVGHPDWMKLKPGVHPSQYGIRYSEIDVALAPIISNGFNNCKSDLKVKEAGAYSIPIITSEFGPYKDHPSSGVYHARTTKEWKEQLYRAMEGQLDGRPNAEYCSQFGCLHNVNLDRVEIFTEVLITK